METITTSQLREGLAHILNRVAFGEERIMVRRHGREIAVILPMKDWELLAAIENNRDTDEIQGLLAKLSDKMAR